MQFNDGSHENWVRGFARPHAPRSRMICLPGIQEKALQDLIAAGLLIEALPGAGLYVLSSGGQYEVDAQTGVAGFTTEFRTVDSMIAEWARSSASIPDALVARLSAIHPKPE